MLLYLVGLVLTAPSIASDSPSKLPRQEQSSEFVRRYLYGSFVLGNTLYIDGGCQTHSIEEVIEQTICIYSRCPFSEYTSRLDSEYHVGD